MHTQRPISPYYKAPSRKQFKLWAVFVLGCLASMLGQPQHSMAQQREYSYYSIRAISESGFDTTYYVTDDWFTFKATNGQVYQGTLAIEDSSHFSLTHQGRSIVFSMAQLESLNVRQKETSIRAFAKFFVWSGLAVVAVGITLVSTIDDPWQALGVGLLTGAYAGNALPIGGLLFLIAHLREKKSALAVTSSIDLGLHPEAFR